MENQEFLSVAEYAKIKGVSVQAVYKQLNNSLKPFVIEVEGKKKIKSTALNGKFKKVVKPLNQPSTEVLNQSLIDTLNKTIDLLQNQLQTKDEQIKALNERLEQALNNTSQSNYIAATAINEGLPTAAEEQSNAAEDTPQKKSILKRIFKR